MGRHSREEQLALGGWGWGPIRGIALLRGTPCLLGFHTERTPGAGTLRLRDGHPSAAAPAPLSRARAGRGSSLPLSPRGSRALTGEGQLPPIRAPGVPRSPPAPAQAPPPGNAPSPGRGSGSAQTHTRAHKLADTRAQTRARTRGAARSPPSLTRAAAPGRPRTNFSQVATGGCRRAGGRRHAAAVALPAAPGPRRRPQPAVGAARSRARGRASLPRRARPPYLAGSGLGCR